MRILLIGEYSNVHYTLCLALRRAGHEVLLVSDGDGWKNYPRDIDLRRRQEGPIGSLRYLTHLLLLLPRMKGWDVVQIINPVFLDVKARWNRWVFRYLKQNNKMVSIGCYGDDYYVISRMQDDSYLTYTDFYASGRKIDHEVNRRRCATWMDGPKATLTRDLIAEADCLVPCLYEYWKVYDTPEFRRKLYFIQLPCELEAKPQIDEGILEKEDSRRSCCILFAAQKRRGQMKGTDQLEPLFDRLAKEYPDKIQLTKVESVPFAEYQRLVSEADVVVDQLYSYTPAMAALESLSRGKIVVSGYEPEYRSFIGGEKESGIINLRPFDDDNNYRILEETLTDPQKIARLKRCSQAYVRKYHDSDIIAKRYVEVFESILYPSSSR